MSIRHPRGRTRRPDLAVRELAVDPADVDRDRYPVRIRLTRALTPHEAQAMSTVDPAVHVEGDALLVPDGKLDDIAHDHAAWIARLERVERMGEELEGEELVAKQGLGEQVHQKNAMRRDPTGTAGFH